MSPTFSVIIPTFNRAKELGRALSSLAAQTFKDFEVIVCDDGSKDDSREVVASFKDKFNVHYLYESNWGGPARPRNKGLSFATGKWIALLDADDYWAPEKLERICELTLSYDLIYHDLAIMLSGEYLAGSVARPVSEDNAFLDLFTRGNAFPNSATSFRRDLYERYGGFQERKGLISVEDFDLWLRFTAAGIKIGFIREKLGYYTVGSNDQLTSNKSKHEAAAIKCLNEHIDSIPTEFKRLALGSLEYRKLLYALSYSHDRNSFKFRLILGSGSISLIAKSIIRLCSKPALLLTGKV